MPAEPSSASTALRPAVFASAFHPHVGGVEELVRQLTMEQRGRGHAPVVVTNRYPKDLPAQEVVEGQDVLRYPFRVPEPTVRQMGGWLLHSRSTQRAVDEVLRRRGADLVHVQCVSSNGRYALAASRALDLPLVVTMQGELTMDATGVYQRSAQLRRTWRALLDRAQVVTGCSDYVLREAEAAYGKPFLDRGRVVYNGIRPADFEGVTPYARPRPYVLGIGRFVTQKGFDVLLRAFALVAAGLPDVDLVLAGDGPVRGELEALVAELGLTGRVELPGRVDHDRAVSLFAGADVFVLPSRHEPQGIVLLEAMAAGAAVVANRVGGVPEVVEDGTNGLLYDNDPEQLAGLLTQLLTDAGLRDRLVGGGRDTASRFSWQAITDQYDEVYRVASISR